MYYIIVNVIYIAQENVLLLSALDNTLKSNKLFESF